MLYKNRPAFMTQGHYHKCIHLSHALILRYTYAFLHVFTCQYQLISFISSATMSFNPIPLIFSKIKNNHIYIKYTLNKFNPMLNMSLRIWFKDGNPGNSEILPCKSDFLKNFRNYSNFLLPFF